MIPATGHTADESGWNSNGTDHWHVCATCKEKFDEAAHTGGTATCSKKAVCDVCKAEYGTTADHTFISKHDDTQHWKECSACGAIDPDNLKTNHTFGEWETVTDSTCTATGTKRHTCTGCDYSETGVIEKKAHTTERHDRVEPTCMATGSIEYWQCGICGKKFSDAACTTEVTDVTLDKLPHSAGTAWEKGHDVSLASLHKLRQRGHGQGRAYIWRLGHRHRSFRNRSRSAEAHLLCLRL